MNRHIAPPAHLFATGLVIGTMLRAIQETPQIVAEIGGALTGVTDIAERLEVQGRNIANVRSSIGVLYALAGVPAAAVGREDLAAALFGIAVGLMIFDQTLGA